VRLRPTTPEDLPALHRLFGEAIAGVYRPHGFEPPSQPLEVFSAQQTHILNSDPDLCRVADDGDGVRGFASAWVRGDDWFLASLFVAPVAQGAGVGASLLDGVWGGHHARRRTITDAIQPVSNALYARRGLVPATPLLTFSGEAPAGESTLEPGDGDLAAIDAAAYGFDRARDHTHWAGVARRTVWVRAGEPVAYSYAFPGGDVGPVAGLDPAAAADALAGELACATGPVRVCIPGSARPLVAEALRSGLRLAPVPGLLLLSSGAEPPAAFAPSGYTLF
jgi:hypothetical protein